MYGMFVGMPCPIELARMPSLSLKISLSKQEKISSSLGKTTNSRAAAKEQAAGTQKAK